MRPSGGWFQSHFFPATMGTMTPRMHFGPDTSIGILPQPHLRVLRHLSGSACLFIPGEKLGLVVGGPGIF